MAPALSCVPIDQCAIIASLHSTYSRYAARAAGGERAPAPSPGPSYTKYTAAIRSG